MKQQSEPIDIWKHRRRLAYTAMAGLLVQLAIVYKVDISQPQADVLGGLALAFAGIVAAYMGFAMMDHASERKARGRGLSEPSELSKQDRVDANQPAREGD